MRFGFYALAMVAFLGFAAAPALADCGPHNTTAQQSTPSTVASTGPTSTPAKPSGS